MAQIGAAMKTLEKPVETPLQRTDMWVDGGDRAMNTVLDPSLHARLQGVHAGVERIVPLQDGTPLYETDGENLHALPLAERRKHSSSSPSVSREGD